MRVLEELAEALTGSAGKHGGEEVAPYAVLWTDKEELWKPAASKLQPHVPALLAYGPFDPAAKTGPAIWIRCMLAGTLDWHAEGVPVVYLPGIGRQELHNAEECPKPLQPLVELQYRGTVWAQPNGKDWTPAAFLASLGLDVSSDEATKSAIKERLLRLLDTDVEELRGLGRLDSVKIRNLGSDWPSAVLAWMESPAERGDDWGAFRAACRTQYGFDPESDGELVAAEYLAEANGSWNAVWTRFALSPKRYSGCVELLRKVAPPGIFDRDEGYPAKNSDAEKQLRTELAKAAKKDAATARARILELEKEHGARRQWVWSELGEAPLACSMEHLAQCAKSTGNALGATSLEDMISRYTKHGYEADLAAWQAYAAADSTDAKLIGNLLRAIYLPWLESAGETFAKLCERSPLRSLWAQTASPGAGECVLFADGLRFDVAKLLEAELGRNGMSVDVKARICGLPSVTPTAKPAVSPITGLLQGTDSGADFRPAVSATGKPLQAESFRELLSSLDIQSLSASETGDPDGASWTEFGALDRLGHDEGARLAKRIREEVKMLGERVYALLEAGWKTVRIVTDHGWLWLPGGLPKSELPAYLAESRWGRCAALKGNASTELQTVPWHYEPSVSIALAPGISCFRAGTEYAHGGLSVQECVVPVLTVTLPTETLGVSIKSVKWTGMMCRVSAEGGVGMRTDIRTKPADATSSIAHDAKALDADGHVTLFVGDDHEGLAAVVVILGEDGRVIAKAPTTVGGSE